MTNLVKALVGTGDTDWGKLAERAVTALERAVSAYEAQVEISKPRRKSENRSAP